MPPQITCASALPGKTEKQRENRIFTQMLYQCIAWIQPAVLFLQSFWLTTHTDDAVWLSKSCNQCVQPAGLLGAMVQEKGSRERCWSWTVLHAQCTSAQSSGFPLSSGFPISQGNAEALDRWGGKTKYRLISYFLSSTSAKNYRNWIVYVKTIASQRWDVFETRCILGSITARHSSSGRQRNFAAFSRAITLGIGPHSSYGRPM